MPKIAVAITILISLMVWGCHSDSETSPETESTPPPAAQAPVDAAATTSLDIKGMTCVSCAASIEDALSKTDGVHTVDVDFGARRADISYDEKLIDKAAIIAVVDEAGFEASATQ